MVYLFAIMAFALIAIILAAIYKPLGDYMYNVFTSDKDLFFEKWIYKIIGVDSKKGQTWKAYLRGLLGFSLMSVLVLYLLQRVQQWLPFSLGFPNVEGPLAFNTAASFVTNTNWQSYSPDVTLGYTVQFAGLAVQNFVSAAVGIAVSIALVRGFAWRKSETIGNFWVDLTRGTLRLLMPISIVMGIILIALGVAQNFAGFVDVNTIAGGTQKIMQGPVASQEVIKELGTNGGGFFNANSSHPYENPNMWTNLIEILLMLCIPVALTRTFGRMVGDVRQGYAILGAMVILFGVSFLCVVTAESFSNDAIVNLTGGSMEGKETRFGIVWSGLFGTTSTSTSTGAVNSMHDSYTALGGMMYMLNMMLGEVSPGGVGAGLYGILVMAVVAVFIAGLMVGRTPEYIGKKIGPREMKMASLYFLVMPITVVVGVSLSFALPFARQSIFDTSLNNSGNHGFSEVVYAFTSAANNNGSAFAGITADTPWLDTALGLAVLLGRFLPIALVIALAGSLAKQDKVPVTAGTMKTDNGLFVILLVFVIVLISALTFFPTLALGPLAEGLVA
ncbi:potassium-transporting ATPase subunit A [Bifidobacterium sp. UTCIF-37]|uniref:Potassium-transporting ATPase potassium-binding subunit n=2 Tax=Bifidobacterium callitrichos TaxID=762209 RepID=A0A2T3G8D3_9BIFI|nr:MULTISPECIES: potassium-transporting ATPase subunit KdpA [Bifidobacterium]KAA8817440.1 potassium-transporting ATPase subunit KdpA [Bifidobacterium callitrichos]KFI56633.1 potassium-transporting ATPase subunit A [Bifidobacterium callitrichos DSM 23973]PST45718.1 potassium-transporting ATPase subunit KdpA [Bifidobacterium callitrichos]TPF86593.1 potassium-transporting ATPase subunit A [Bifidobacterium sp. UTCIF-37]TPF90211.1 potassium-transporting ATPase subunit A [Bifidobacterium sp. UTCIF-3